MLCGQRMLTVNATIRLQSIGHFLAGNSESLLGSPTISRWVHFSLRINSKRIVRSGALPYPIVFEARDRREKSVVDILTWSVNL